MADKETTRLLIVSEPLCFARSRLGKISENLLKSVMMDYFKCDQLTIAKNRLCDDTEKLNIENWSRPANHRDTDNKAKLEVTDIVNIFIFLDQQLMIDNLPIYVCEDIDRIPSTKWMDGDLQLLIAKINKLEEDNIQLKKELHDQNVLIVAQAKLIMNTVESQMQAVLSKMFSVEAIMKGKHDKNDKNDMNVHFPPLSVHSVGLPSTSWAASSASTEIHDVDMPNDNTRHQLDQLEPITSNYATAAANTQHKRPSFHLPTHNLYTPIAAESDTDHSAVGADGPWMEARPRTKKRKTESAVLKTNKSKTKIVGKSKSTQLKASEAELHKSVFCVSNISAEFECRDLVSFLSDSEVNVLTCFDAKTKFEGTKSFRVCVASKDVDKFLNPELWPENVIIRDWVWKGKKLNETNNE